MKMKKYKCKCGSTNLWMEKKGMHTGLYCNECGAWVKFLTKQEARLWKHNHEKKKDGEQTSFKDDDIVIIKYNQEDNCFENLEIKEIIHKNDCTFILTVNKDDERYISTEEYKKSRKELFENLWIEEDVE